MANQIVNKYGTFTGWNKVTLILFGTRVDAVEKIEYSDNKEIENVYGAGEFPVGQKEGNYKAECKISLFLEAQQQILNAIPKGARIQDGTGTIEVVYQLPNNSIMTDVIEGVRIKNMGRSLSQGDGTSVFEHDILASQILYNQT